MSSVSSTDQADLYWEWRLRREKHAPKHKKEFLGKPLGHKSHELLHTHYTKRQKYPSVGEPIVQAKEEQLVK